MNVLERQFYELQFWKHFLRSRGTAFEDLFREVMCSAYPGDFVPCHSSGRLGDRKNDGYWTSKRIIFQLYAPIQIKSKNVIKKIASDFTGAVTHWAGQFDTWVFVYNSDAGLAPDILYELNRLRLENPAIKIEAWGYYEMVRHFRQADLNTAVSLYGHPPAELRSRKSKTKLNIPKNTVLSRSYRRYLEPTPYIAETHSIIDQSATKNQKAVIAEMISACMRYYRERSFDRVFKDAARMKQAIPLELANELRNAFDHIAVAYELILPIGPDISSIRVQTAVLHVERARCHIAVAAYYSVQHTIHFFLTRTSKLIRLLEDKERRSEQTSSGFRKRLSLLSRRARSIPLPTPMRRSSTEQVVRDIVRVEQYTTSAMRLEFDCARLFEEVSDF
jgi:hypothetical protein